VREPRIVTFYRELPEPTPFEDAELWTTSLGSTLERFQRRIQDNYTEATLVRLLSSASPVCRRAAVVALGLIGTMSVNAAVAGVLQDNDALVRQLANSAMWAIWFRGRGPDQAHKLEQIIHLPDKRSVLRGLDAFVRQSDDFAEAYNQRAIVYYGLGDFRKAVADCETVLRLNPYHFGAAAGMAQCLLRLNQPHAALRAFRTALEINPNLDDVEAAVKALEEALGEGAEDV
jgi:tetratricopeptide (TPR) repeat protein